MPFRILPATEQHARQIAEVHVAAWRSTYQGIVPQAALDALDVEARTKYWTNLLANVPPRVAVFVALQEGGQVAGFAAGGPVRAAELQADGELYAIYLDPASQRQGMGRALFAAIARHLRDENFSSLGVWVLERNPCRGFYEALGGEVVASQPIDIGGVALVETGYRWQSTARVAGADE